MEGGWSEEVRGGGGISATKVACSGDEIYIYIYIERARGGRNKEGGRYT